MTVHAPTDVLSITIPTDRGGCGRSHELPDPAGGGPRTVDCPACEPHIIASRTGWAHDPIAVALTCDEIAQVEAAERDAKVEQNRTWSNPARLREALFGNQPTAAAPSLLEQIAALSAEERAALAGMLTAQTPEPEPEAAPVVKKTTPPRKAVKPTDPAT